MTRRALALDLATGHQAMVFAAMKADCSGHTARRLGGGPSARGGDLAAACSDRPAEPPASAEPTRQDASTAVASISTSAAGSTRAVTPTTAMVGKCLPITRR